MEVEYSLIEESLCRGFIEKSMKIVPQNENRVYRARNRTEISLPIPYRDGESVKVYIHYTGTEPNDGIVGKVMVSDCGITAIHQGLNSKDFEKIYNMKSYDFIWFEPLICEREIATYPISPSVDEVYRAIKEITSFICDSYLFIGQQEKEHDDD